VVSAITAENQELATGRITRVLVELDPFLQKACSVEE